MMKILLTIIANVSERPPMWLKSVMITLLNLKLQNTHQHLKFIPVLIIMSSNSTTATANVLRTLGFNDVVYFEHVKVTQVKIEGENYYVYPVTRVNDQNTNFTNIRIIDRLNGLKIVFNDNDDKTSYEIYLEKYHTYINGHEYELFRGGEYDISGYLMGDMYSSIKNRWRCGNTLLDTNFMPVNAQKIDIVSDGFKFVSPMDIECVLNDFTIFGEYIADGEYVRDNELPGIFKFYNKKDKGELFALLSVNDGVELASNKRIIKLTSQYRYLLKKQHGGLYGGYIIKTKLTSDFMRFLIDGDTPNGKSVVIEDSDCTYRIFRYKFTIFALLNNGKIVELDVCAPNSGMRTKAAAQSE